MTYRHQLTYVVVSLDRRTQLAKLLSIGEEQIVHIPSGVDLCSFLRISPTGARLAKEHNLLRQDILMLLPARVTKRKNIELALRVLAELVSGGVAAKLVVTGPPGPHDVRSSDYLAELLALRAQLGLEDRAVFLCLEKGEDGEPLRVDQSLMSDLYALSDLLFFPSLQEGFGIPVLEAGVARLPVFCSDIAPFRETGKADAHYFGLEETPRAIATRIRQFTEGDPGYQLRKRAVKDYTWTAIFQERMEPLLRMLGAQPRLEKLR